jgi:hypothetical protein
MKNHPHDNIYSILGKLDALKPTPEEKRFALVKEIRESVEAKGSILSGVDAVQAKLARQFAESDFSKMSAAIQKTGKSKASADAITAVAGREKLGQKEMTRRSVAGRKDESYNPVKAVKQCAKDYMEMNGIRSIHDLEAEDIESIGGDCQMNYHDVCEILGIQLPDSLGPVQSWDTDERGNKFDLEEGTCNECGMMEGSCEHTMREGEFAGRSAKYGVCVVGHNGGKPVKMFDTEAEAEAYAKKGIRIDGKLLQGSVRTIVGEGEITRKHGVTTHTKTDYPGYPTDDTEDSLDHLSGPGTGKKGRPRKAQTKNPRPDPNAPKKGRGRPASVKTSGPVSMPADPFGRTTGVAPKGKRGTVHTMGEAMDLLGKQLAQLNEGRYLEDSAGESFNHILNRFRAEVRNFEQGGDLDKDLYDALYDYYVECGEMPYGVQKARDADPMNWVAERLDVDLGNHAYGSDPANAEGYGIEDEGIEGNMPPVDNIPGKEDLLKGKGRSYYEEEVTMEDELNELARLAGIQTEGNAFSGKLANTAKGDNFEHDGETFTNRSSIADKELDEETDEGNAFGQAVRNAKADGVQPGEKVEVDGNEIPVKEGMEMSSEPDASDFNISTSMSSDGDKNVTVTATGKHAASLLQMLRIAGLGGGEAAQALQQPQAEPEMGNDEGAELVVIGEPEAEVDEADVSVDQPAEQPANAPDPEYKSMRASTMGPGEGDNGEKAMNPDRPTFKNGDNALSNPPARGKEVLKAVAALESKLAKEYESIKKVSK